MKKSSKTLGGWLAGSLGLACIACCALPLIGLTGLTATGALAAAAAYLTGKAEAILCTLVLIVGGGFVAKKLLERRRAHGEACAIDCSCKGATSR